LWKLLDHLRRPIGTVVVHDHDLEGFVAEDARNLCDQTPMLFASL
jgi:hypothetical protein